ncbi:hypothetical protein G6M04_14650 [Agrobacterium rhizogenes]|uniref:hypothetical protein n=1 Tax=Rhizobium rhizogenes TaxID=359 RepID=UPI0015749A49|nr:hypothetical protein [Rhizobium rhizogenes]NTG48630.1 hypothetical protein [Rhizobium rhizogenes]
MQKLEELITALEMATGPNYALEVEIFKYLHPEYADYVQGRGGLVHTNDGCDQRVLSDVRPGNYTSSIDAAIALTERLLPGWSWTTSDRNRRIIAPKREDGPWGAVNSPAWWDEDESDEYFEAFASTPAIALVLSTLRAKLSQEMNNADK